MSRPHAGCSGMLALADCISFAAYMTVKATGGQPAGGCGWCERIHYSNKCYLLMHRSWLLGF